ncbi:MAG: sigma factor-like helix-turn-helix DNA-binding protein [Bacteroidota bacterium]
MALLSQEIEKLPKKCKMIFLQGKKEGLKYQEIADRLNISIKTVEVHMSKALSRLRNVLNKN